LIRQHVGKSNTVVIPAKAGMTIAFAAVGKFIPVPPDIGEMQ
jgi:hypothetical protein